MLLVDSSKFVVLLGWVGLTFHKFGSECFLHKMFGYGLPKRLSGHDGI